MKPCVACQQQYGKYICNSLGHCVFEGSGEWPTPVEEAPHEDHMFEEQRLVQV